MRAILSFLIISISLTGFSQTSFSLEQAVNYALANHNSIESAGLDIQDAKYQIRETAAIGIPQVDGSILYNHYLKLKPGLVPEAFFDSLGSTSKLLKLPAFGSRNNFGFGVSFSSLIFDFSYIVGLKAAKRFKDLTHKRLDLTKQQVERNVRDAYIATFIIQVTEETLKKNIKNLEKSIYETQQLYENGFVEQLDVDRLELSANNLNYDLKKLSEQKVVLINVLKFQMGFPIEEELILLDNIESLKDEALAAEVNEEVLDYSKRKEFDVFEIQLELNEMNAQRLRAGYYPNVVAFGEFTEYLEGNRLLQSGGGFWSYSSVIGFQINIPFFDGLEKKNSIQRARINYEKIDLQRDDLIQAVKLEIRNAQLNYKNAISTLNSAKESLNLAEKIYNTTQIKYKEGVGSSIEVTQAESSLYQAQANYNNAVYEILVAKTDLDAAKGN